jgi:hypothetical protein
VLAVCPLLHDRKDVMGVPCSQDTTVGSQWPSWGGEEEEEEGEEMPAAKRPRTHDDTRCVG